MGVDINTYRGRIGSFSYQLGLDVVTITFVLNFSRVLKCIGSVVFIGLLLIIAGIEQNPGPNGKAKHCNGTGGITKKIQDKAWATICEKVNSVGNAKRFVAEVKEKWRNLTKKAKTETTMQKVSMQKTGGGPPAPLPDPLLDDIAGLFCSSASFHGIPGATDCETVTISLRLDEEDAYADEIPSMVINAEELQKVDEISSAANSAAPIQGSRASAAPCPSSSTSDREPLVCDKSSKPQNELVNHFTKMPQKSLKELQMEFYTVSIQNEREKFKLIQEQTALCRELRENIPKLSLVLDALCTKKDEE